MSKTMAWAACALAVWPLAACAVEKPAVKAPPETTGMAAPARIPDVAPAVQPGESVQIASVPRDVRRAVVADAAKRFKVEESAVVLVNAEKVTWNDGALGCPEPGKMYAQMMVDGFRLVAKTAAGSLLYHTNASGDVVNCRVPVAKQLGPPVMDTEPKPYPPAQAAPEK
jgi:hypothetical protein